MQWITDPIASLLETIIWIAVLVGFVVAFRGKFSSLVDAIVERIVRGADVELPFASLRGAPPEIRSGEEAVATSDGAGGGDASSEAVEARLERKEYPPELVDNVYLIHRADVIRARTANRPGAYRVRVWVEGYTTSVVDDVETVTYRLYDDFNKRVLSTSRRDRDFELWMNVYGEFTVIACATRRSGEAIWLSRYIDLPGRPPE